MPEVGEDKERKQSGPKGNMSSLEKNSPAFSKKEMKPPFNFKEEINSLITPFGKEKPIVTNDLLLGLAEASLLDRNQTPEKFQYYLEKGEDWLLEKKISKENAEEWQILAGTFEKRKSELEDKVFSKSKANQKFEVGGEINERIEKILLAEKEVKNIESQLKPFSGDLTPEEEKQRAENLENLKRAQMRLYILTGKAGDQDMEGFASSTEKFPDIRDIGPEEFKKRFRDKVHALMDEYPEQSFETNWTLVWPLQQGINSLWPKEHESQEITDKNGKKWLKENGDPYLFADLRKELADQLEAYRNIHNFRYIYRRVSGVGDVIGAASLLEKRFLDFLLKDGDEKLKVGGVLKQMEIAGEKYKIFEDADIKYENNQFNFDFKKFNDYLNENEQLQKALIKDFKEEYKKSLEEYKRKYPEKAKTITFNEFKKTVMENLRETYLRQIVDEQEKNWQGKVAGALYCAFGRSWAHGVSLNESGDFFCGRLFNMPGYAKRRWEGDWKRDPFPELYEAMDLRVDDFWDDVFKKVDEKDLEKMGVRKILGKKKNNKDNDKGKYVKNFYSFANADFNEIDLSQIKGVVSDQMRQVILDLEEADHIRKRILNPKGFLDEPGLRHINGMYEEFKYLKGEKRSDWMKNIIKQVVVYFRDETMPGFEDFPMKLRKCRAQEINSNYVGWTNRTIVNAVEGLTPPLTEDDKEKLLTEVVGSKIKRGASSAAKTTTGVIGSVVWGGVKGFLGGIFKGFLGGK